MALNDAFTAGQVLTASEMNNLPFGICGKQTKTTDATVNSGIADVSGMSITWTADSSRLYRLSFVSLARTTTAGNVYISVFITDASNNIKQYIRQGATTTDMRFTITGFLYESGLSGSITRKIRAETNTGTGTLEAGGNLPMQFMVEDMGLA